MSSIPSILLLGSGELGKEVAISAQRFGVRVIAADRYEGAPAMQVAHVAEVFSMLDGDSLEAVVRRHQPDAIVPEVEAIRTDRLAALESDGFRVIPTAEAVRLTLDREGIRRLASGELGLRTARFAFAGSAAELAEACDEIGYPCVVKPVMSSSGKGQSTVAGPSRVEQAWTWAVDGGRGDDPRVIVEEFIEFDSEITLLTLREATGEIHVLDPVGHRQERGDYRESWMPASLPAEALESCEAMARSVVDRLGGRGLFGVEFFISGNEAIFSELSPRPHDTGLVTLVSQDLSQFDLHVRAILGFPVPGVARRGPAATAVILARETGTVTGVSGVDRALRIEGTDIRIFGKPEAWPGRRMGVALARAESVEEARARALEAASRVQIHVGGG